MIITLNLLQIIDIITLNLLQKIQIIIQSGKSTNKVWFGYRIFTPYKSNCIGALDRFYKGVMDAETEIIIASG